MKSGDETYLMEAGAWRQLSSCIRTSLVWKIRVYAGEGILLDASTKAFQEYTGTTRFGLGMWLPQVNHLNSVMSAAIHRILA
jgi:hypothetical protein